MDIKEVRLRCLELAYESEEKINDVLEVASDLYRFVETGINPKLQSLGVMPEGYVSGGTLQISEDARKELLGTEESSEAPSEENPEEGK